MVRFKVAPLIATDYYTRGVSIPIWFDLKYRLRNQATKCFDCFNSYMVRFKELLVKRFSKYSAVSIPIWFDLKTVLVRAPLVVLLRFNSYMVRFKDSSRPYMLFFRQCFNSYMVRFKAPVL